jgi:hypothetical protein
MIPDKLAATDTGIHGSGRRSHETGHEAWRTAWQKEMERMQADAWLGHGVLGGMDAGAVQARSQQGQQVPSQPRATGQPHEPGQEPLAEPAPTATMRALVADLRTVVPGLEIQASARALGVPVVVAQTRPHVARASIEAGKGAPRNQETPGDLRAARGVERQAVRLHAEWTRAGVQVWLGMDAGAAIAAAQLLQQLQRSLGASGCRLLSVTCNGQPAPLGTNGFSPPNFLKEMEAPTWPSAL